MTKESTRYFATLVSGVLLACMATSTLAAPFVIESPPERVALLELYTSEGCSSCPPADRWVSGLKTQPDLWRRFIPVSFHVDYWDYIGWPDRFASPAYSDRQRRHASEQSMRTIYTPGFFLNGAEWRWRGRDLQADLEKAPAGILQLEISDADLTIRFDSELPHGGLQASVALLGFGIETQVKAGENAGRTLNHDFVVLSIDLAPLKRDGDVFKATLAPPSRTVEAERYAIVAWVNSEGNQVPIQAAGGWWELM
jgi:hypothetical protein